MNDSKSLLCDLILRARNGDDTALGELCNRHRAYLRLIAQRTLDTNVKVRADESDLVQQTMLSAVRNFHQFEGSQPGQFVAWLQIQHERNVIDAARAHRADKRNVGREQAAPSKFEPSGSRRDSPSMRAMLSEEVLQLAAAMEELPEAQREAVRLRHLEGWSLKEIAESMDRTDEAVAGLLKRGMKGLRETVQSGVGD